jgi:hypothetical protein
MHYRGRKLVTHSDVLLASDMGPSPNGRGAIRVGPDVGKTITMNEAQREAEDRRLRKFAKRAGK